MKRILLFALALPFCYLLAFAEVTIKAEVSKRQITTDDPLTYKVTVSSEEPKIPSLHLPDLSAFIIASEGQSTELSFTEPNLVTRIVFTYVLVAKNPGKLIIAPSTIKIGEQSFSSESFEIEVLAGKERPISPPAQKEPFPASGQPQYSL